MIRTICDHCEEVIAGDAVTLDLGIGVGNCRHHFCGKSCLVLWCMGLDRTRAKATVNRPCPSDFPDGRHQKDRTVAEVEAARNSSAGCCYDDACGRECSCLYLAKKRELKAMETTPIADCSICNDPNCDNPGGKH